jgi:xanthine dehydrogenase accessory factor
VRLLRFLDERQARREGVVVCTVVRAAAGGGLAVGEHALHDPAGIASGGGLSVGPALADVVRATFAEQRSRLTHLEEGDVFVEWVGPTQRLFVFGSGHDVVPVATIADMMGWSLTVADFRSPHLQPRRFPTAERIFAIPSSGDLSDLGISSDDAVVVMTHNYAQDAALLPQILAVSPRYLGLLGPRARAEKLFKEIDARPIADNVYAPMGLAIGGEHPESIALAIAAEIQAVLHQQPGGHLRRYPGAIHAPALELGVAAPTPAWTADQLIQPSCDTANA